MTETIAEALACWALRDERDRLLDPSCGDGRFIAADRSSVGIEQDPLSAKQASNPLRVLQEASPLLDLNH